MRETINTTVFDTDDVMAILDPHILGKTSIRLIKIRYLNKPYSYYGKRYWANVNFDSWHRNVLEIGLLRPARMQTSPLIALAEAASEAKITAPDRLVEDLAFLLNKRVKDYSSLLTKGHSLAALKKIRVYESIDKEVRRQTAIKKLNIELIAKREAITHTIHRTKRFKISLDRSMKKEGRLKEQIGALEARLAKLRGQKHGIGQ